MIQNPAGAVSISEVSRWREAYRLASEAERSLFDAAMMHEWGQGPKPTEAQCDSTTRLRQSERALFKRASAEFADPVPA